MPSAMIATCRCTATFADPLIVRLVHFPMKPENAHRSVPSAMRAMESLPCVDGLTSFPVALTVMLANRPEYEANAVKRVPSRMMSRSLARRSVAPPEMVVLRQDRVSAD